MATIQTNIKRHHAEWLSLLESSGPFLTIDSLKNAFPQGIDIIDTDKKNLLKSAYEEWLDNQQGLHPEKAIHKAWIDFVLQDGLEYDDVVLREGQGIPEGIKAAFQEHGVVLRPDRILVDPADSNRTVLLIKVYSAGQKLNKAPSGSRWQASCETRMMDLLHATEIPLGLVTNGEQWTLVYARPGESTGFTTWYANLWFEEKLTLQAFVALLSASRFFSYSQEMTLLGLLKDSEENQHEVTEQLGSQVRSAVEIFIQSLDDSNQDRHGELLADIPMERLYEAALTFMMRLVFLLSAEERLLLPLNDPFYDEYYAVSSMASQLRERADQVGEDVLHYHHDAYSRLLALFRLVYGGTNHDRLSLPAYGGSLFDPDRFPFLEGRLTGTSWLDTPARPLPISNRTVLHILESLQYLGISTGGYKEARRLSYRALDVEQIGHVYEGLLEYKAIRADSDMVGIKETTKYPLPVIDIKSLENANDVETQVKLIKEVCGKSESSIRNLLKKETDHEDQQRLLTDCNNDPVLQRRALPYFHILRKDDFQRLVIIPKGSIYVGSGTTRRSTGTHYTPRSLTEPIVKHTLEPLIYEGPAEGWEKADWQLRTPVELLALKVCDMAMGSGSFLVQVIRFLSERLMEAWNARTAQDSADVERDVLGNIALEPNEALPKDREERFYLAQRLIADRCIYGVDKNPLAVEMAKLSIWLVTLDKNRPFTFLDHALKCGDSLVGAEEKDFRQWARRKVQETTWSLFDEQLELALEAARTKRKELTSFLVHDIRDAEHKAGLLQKAEQAAERVKTGCDLLIGARMQGLSGSTLEAEENWLLTDWQAGDLGSDRCQRALDAAQDVNAFHWFLEFPEVFEHGGFDAFVGNPPFRGGLLITVDFDLKYTTFLKLQNAQASSTTDLCAYFVYSAYHLLKLGGFLGLILTSSITEGDTKKASLSYLIKQGAEVIRANPVFPWPGDATLHISTLIMTNQGWNSQKFIGYKKVLFINSNLEEFPEYEEPQKLIESSQKAFLGTTVYGKGFFLTDEELEEFKKLNPNAKKYVRPFINGNDVSHSPKVTPKRYVLYMQQLKKEELQNRQWLHDYARKRIYESRQKSSSKRRRDYWWLYTSPAEALYEAVSPYDRVLLTCFTSKYVSFIFVNSNMIFSNAVIAIADNRFSVFSNLQSTIHQIWVHFNGSTLEIRQRYTLSSCFETFPFANTLSLLETIGKKYHELRQEIMTNQLIGLTDLYNSFHNPDEMGRGILNLRNLHIELDNAIASAYGWSDLNLGHDFFDTQRGLRYTINEAARREVLTRLLKLNHQRYKEEVAAGLHDKKKPKAKRKAKNKKATSKTSAELQLSLLGDSPEPPAKQEVLIESAKPDQTAIPTHQIGDWDQCVCLGCGKHLAGFQVKDHTKNKHHGEDPGYRKLEY